MGKSLFTHDWKLIKSIRINYIDESIKLYNFTERKRKNIKMYYNVNRDLIEGMEQKTISYVEMYDGTIPDFPNNTYGFRLNDLNNKSQFHIINRFLICGLMMIQKEI